MAIPSGFAEVATLAGDPTRAAMLHELMDGRELTASELARTAGVAPPTASGHLARLTDASLLRVRDQGRHRYYRLASPAVAAMMEAVMQVAAEATTARRPIRTGPRDEAMREARTCYDHLAGRVAVAIADGLVAAGHIELGSDSGIVTESGLAMFGRIGIDLNAPPPGRRAGLVCRPCLDWSERRPHLAGALGTALCRHCLDQGWLRRVSGSRAVTQTPLGRRMLRDTFGVTEH